MSGLVHLCVQIKVYRFWLVRRGDNCAVRRACVSRKGVLLHNAWVRGGHARRSGPLAECGAWRRRRDFAHWEHRFGGGLYSARRRLLGLCALEGSFRRGFVQWRPALVYKVPFKQGRQCTKSLASKSPVCKPPSKQGRQCTKSGRAHLGSSDGASAAPHGSEPWLRARFLADFLQEPTHTKCRRTPFFKWEYPLSRNALR